MTLDQLPLGQSARISAIGWDELRPAEAKKLRDLGFDEGVVVEPLHKAAFGGDPLACRVGRMTIALRRACAEAISVTAFSEAEGT